MMDTANAEVEISKLKVYYQFDYMIDQNIFNKTMTPINKPGWNMDVIVSKLKFGEKILFYLNDGAYCDWDNKTCKYKPTRYVKEFIGSIYWPHETEGICIRINSDQGSLQKWFDESFKTLNDPAIRNA